MASGKQVVLIRSDNRLVMDPTTTYLFNLIAPQLSYVEKVFLRGVEKKKRLEAGGPPFDEILWDCYARDHKDRLSTSFGFYDRIYRVLKDREYQVDLRWASSKEARRARERDNTIYKPRWDKIEALIEDGFEFRYKQRRALELIAEMPNGRIDCHGGWGKGTLIMLACKLFPMAKIDVITKRIPVLHQRLYPELAMNLPSVGLVGGGKKIKNRRVLCISADSLHHGRPDADFVFVDEGHEACADKFAGSLGMYEHAHMWALSATWDMRLDNKDLRGEAMFGPIRMRVKYKEGVKHKIVVPIEVQWEDVIMDVNPCAGLVETDKDRWGLWRNKKRNRIIKRIANEYDEDTQVLISVNTVEHALCLKQLLPDFELVYSPTTQKPEDWNWFARQGLLPENFRPLTEERRQRITKRFEKGKLKKAIATTTWNVGVNFRHLQVLIRADGGSSPTVDTQLPCRNARPHILGGHLKEIAIIRDLKDQFDVGFRQKADRRASHYEDNEWKQHQPDRSKRSKLRQEMNWGDKNGEAKHATKKRHSHG